MSAPAKKFTVGDMSATIWEQQHQHGTTFNTTFARSFKKGNGWEESTSFGPAALGTISMLAQMAAFWITAEIERRRNGQRGNGDRNGEDSRMDRNGPQSGNTRGSGTRSGTRGNGYGEPAGMRGEPSGELPPTEDYPPY